MGEIVADGVGTVGDGEADGVGVGETAVPVTLNRVDTFQFSPTNIWISYSPGCQPVGGRHSVKP